LIKTLAAGLNPVDAIKLSIPLPKYPTIDGIDGCGLIEKMGSKVDTKVFAPGKLVYFFCSVVYDGSFGEYTIQDSRAISLVPEEALKGKKLEDVAIEFGSLPCAAYTAFADVCMKLGLPLNAVEKTTNVKYFKNILVTGASGGVGGFTLQLLRVWKENLPKEHGDQVKIIALASPEKFDYVKSLGATHAISYQGNDVAKHINELVKEDGVDALIDYVVTEDMIELAFSVLNFGGEIVSNLPGPSNLDCARLFRLGASYHVVAADHYYHKKLPHQSIELQKNWRHCCTVGSGGQN